MRRSSTIQRQIELYKESVKNTKYFKVTCLVKWFNEPTSLSTENVIQTLHIRGKDKEDALQRVKAKFGNRYEPFKIELV
jgi:hypothetical protein